MDYTCKESLVPCDSALGLDLLYRLSAKIVLVFTNTTRFCPH